MKLRALLSTEQTPILVWRQVQDFRLPVVRVAIDLPCLVRKKGERGAEPAPLPRTAARPPPSSCCQLLWP